MDVLRCKRYETIIIFTEKFNETEFNLVLNNYEKVLREDLPADIINVEKLGKRKLAYPVKECDSGWYGVVHFRCEPEKIKYWEYTLRVDSHVLRFLTTNVEEDTEEIRDELFTAKTLLESESIEGESEQEASPGTTPDAAKLPVDIFDLIYGTGEKGGDI